MGRASDRETRLRRALEDALAEALDDLAAHMAYADFLTEQGDPRGEFVQVQLALEDPGRPATEREDLQKREAALLKQHGRKWLGDLAPYLCDGRLTTEPPAAPSVTRPEPPVDYQYRFVRGWLDSLHVPSLSVEFAAILSQSPEARLLRRLVVEHRHYEDEVAPETQQRYAIPWNAGFAALYPLRRSPYLTNVRVFQLGELPDEALHISEYQGNQDVYLDFRCHTQGEAAADVVRQMPRLEELYLFADHVDTESLFGLKTLTRLRVLQVYHNWDYPLERLAHNAALGRLTHLLLHPKASGHWSDDTPYIKLKGVRELLRATHLQSLQHLQLRLTDMGDQGCEAIVKSGVLKRLKVLDLRHGLVTDAGARTLAASPDVGNLELLDLSRNRLTTDGFKALASVVKRVLAEYPYTENDVAEERYLWDGDIE